MRFAAVQGVEREENLAELTPQPGLLSTEAVKGEVGQIGKTQIAKCYVGGSIDRRFHSYAAR